MEKLPLFFPSLGNQADKLCHVKNQTILNNVGIRQKHCFQDVFFALNIFATKNAITKTVDLNSCLKNALFSNRGCLVH